MGGLLLLRWVLRGERDGDKTALCAQQPEPEPGEHSEPRHSSLFNPPAPAKGLSHILHALLPFLRSERWWLSTGKGWRVTSGVNTACSYQILLPGSAQRQMARSLPTPRGQGVLDTTNRVLGRVLQSWCSRQDYLCYLTFSLLVVLIWELWFDPENNQNYTNISLLQLHTVWFPFLKNKQKYLMAIKARIVAPWATCENLLVWILECSISWSYTDLHLV